MLTELATAAAAAETAALPSRPQINLDSERDISNLCTLLHEITFEMLGSECIRYEPAPLRAIAEEITELLEDLIRSNQKVEKEAILAKIRSLSDQAYSQFPEHEMAKRLHINLFPEKYWDENGIPFVM